MNVEKGIEVEWEGNGLRNEWNENRKMGGRKRELEFLVPVVVVVEKRPESEEVVMR